jgi:hypothetical protein
MKIKQILILITLVSIYISCDKKENDIVPNVDTYPMTVGTVWTYDRQVIIKKYESETSNNIVDIDTINFTVKVWIEKDTILNDTMSVKVFKSRENDNNWTSNQFKYLDIEGLRNYGYSNPGGANVFAKKSSLIKYGLSADLYKTVDNGILTSDDIIFEDKPTLDIKLPLGDNSSWTYRKPSDTRILQINKCVIGNETLKLLGGSFACYKVAWEYLNVPVFDGVEITDWISNKGLIKRETIHDRVTLTTQDGEPIDGNVQLKEILILKALTIK